MRNRNRKRLLQAECLESRNLMAIAAVDLRILEDVDGQPGQEIHRALEVGESFFVDIQATERAGFLDGLASVALDIHWDPQVLKSLDSPAAIADVITDALPLYRLGELNADAGRITNLSAMSFAAAGAGHRIGDGRFEHFALLHFQATQATDAALISLAEGISQINTSPVISLSRDDLDFDIETLQIVAVSNSETASDSLQNQSEQSGETIDDRDGADSSSGTEGSETSVDNADNTDNSETPSDGSITTVDTSTVDTSTVDTSTVDTSPVEYTPAQIDITTQIDGPSEVRVHDQFTVTIKVAQYNPEFDGIGGLALDIDWDPSQLRLVLDSDQVSDLITDAFPNFRSGTVDPVNGYIDELTAAALESISQGHAIGNQRSEEFVTLTFEALVVTDSAAIKITLGDGGAGLTGDVSGDSVSARPSTTEVRISPQLVLPQIIVTTSSNALDRLMFGNVRADAPQIEWVHPNQHAPHYIEIYNDGETMLDVSAVLINNPALSLATQDADAIDGFELAPGAARRLAFEFQAGAAIDLDDAHAITIISNASNRPRYDIAAEAHTTYAADLNADGRVNIADVVLLDTVFGAIESSSQYKACYDPNRDGSIDLGDFGLLNVQYGLSRFIDPILAAAKPNDRDSQQVDDQLLTLLAEHSLQSMD